MSVQPENTGGARDGTVGLAAILTEISQETERLAKQCGLIQGSISAMLDTIDHPNLGAEIHMLQDIDRIQQTLEDIAAILDVTRGHANGAPILKDEIGSAIRLESLRQRLGLSANLPGDAPGPEDPDITWL